jgi:hypothetical protein
VEKTTQRGAYDLYSLQNIIRAIKSRRLRWAGNFARMEKKRDAYIVQGFSAETSGKDTT